MCRSSTTQSGRRVGRDSRNSTPDGNVSTSKPAERSRRRRAMRTGSSSSTTAIRGLVLVTSVENSKRGGPGVLDLGPIRPQTARCPGAQRVEGERRVEDRQVSEVIQRPVQSRTLRPGDRSRSEQDPGPRAVPARSGWEGERRVTGRAVRGETPTLLLPSCALRPGDRSRSTIAVRKRLPPHWVFG